MIAHTLLRKQMFRSHEGALAPKQSSAAEDAIDDGLGEIGVVEDRAPQALLRR